MVEGLDSLESKVDPQACCSKTQILLADDLIFNMLPISQLIRHFYDMFCDQVGDGQQMVDIYKSNVMKTCCDARYRIILTDINMPNLDGI